MGKSIIVFEGGESMRFDEHVIQSGIRGARRVMKHLGMLTQAPHDEENVFCSNSFWVRAKSSGMFTATVHSGKEVKKNQIIGKIQTHLGSSKQR